jgi:hypothetical protein
MQQVSTASGGKQANVKRFKKLGPVVLDEEVAPNRLDVDHVEEFGALTCSYSAVRFRARLVLQLGEVEQPVIKVDGAAGNIQYCFM